MFQDQDLKNHLVASSSVKTRSTIIAEWNLNIAGNIQKIGNYRYRHTQNESVYKQLVSAFDPKDVGLFYTNATDADVVIDGGYDDDNIPMLLKSKKDKIKMLYSLEDCFKQFRPRSGINKAMFFKVNPQSAVTSGRYVTHANINMSKRPRYYLSDKDDEFKYWTSFRTESPYKYTYTSGKIQYGQLPTFVDDDTASTVRSGVMQNTSDFGIANIQLNGQNYIEDAVPFVVYNKELPSNRIVLKMQTHVGTYDFGSFTKDNKTFSDPFYGTRNQATPLVWSVEVLKNNNWSPVISFNESSKRKDGTSIIGPDGYVELSYGIKIPNRFLDKFIYAETFTGISLLPTKSVEGYAYLIKDAPNARGTFYVWMNGKYETFIPEYGWSLESNEVTRLTNFVNDLTSPNYFVSSGNSQKVYTELDYISGVRLVVKSMNTPNSTLDLIEISPRLAVDIADRVVDYSITKSASDLGQSGLPVGQLLASSGSINIFDYDNSFNENNNNSILKNLITKNLQVKFYETIQDLSGYDYHIPIKTMYADGFFQNNHGSKTTSIKLRDLFFYFESVTAPQILLRNISLSSAVSILLDSVGFSNYVFKRVPNESELTIPFFFIPPDKNVAEILQELAISTQTAMFFDEYNNFVLMSKNYMLPSATERSTDFTFYGSADSGPKDVIESMRLSNDKISNIIDVASEDQYVYNAGVINYSTRYIQRSVGSIKQASLIDNEQSFIYKPSLLWEVSGEQNLKSKNGDNSSQSTYVLSAIPLNSDLTDQVPSVSSNKIINNTIDLGEGSFWITRYNGYFYANGEIIKYDAVQFNISGFGNVWITSTEDYQYYFSKLPFNGKIYPTGLIRIYTEPNYETIGNITRLKNGAVAAHGRCQFNTGQINSTGSVVPVKHFAGLNPYWTNDNNIRGCVMKSSYLFTNDAAEYTATIGEAGINNTLAKKTSRNSIIKNFLSSKYIEDSKVSTMQSSQSGTIQSSALVMNGPTFTTSETPIDFISYVYKPLTDSYKHFGTRMRIVGKIENNTNRGQTAIGSSTYYVVPGETPEKTITISGGSGGLGVLLNPATNNGYYFEIAAVGTTDINTARNYNVNNVLFYKVMQGDAETKSAVPVKLYEGLSNIIVDDGKFTGQYRMVAEENPTVYDLGVEYEDVGTKRRFYLYLNDTLIATVVDENPLPIYNNMAVFVRGSAKCMFENIYALSNTYSDGAGDQLNLPGQGLFQNNEISTNDSFRKYAMSGIVQGTYLSGISPSDTPKYNLYFEEFGTILREASLFDVKYDKAYPAIYAQLSPTFNRIKGYTVSGFRAGSYGAQFMVFNATDTALSLDETTGNYLRIQGVTFTQESQNKLTMDEYFNKNSDFSNPQFNSDNTVKSPYIAEQAYEDIKVSRIKYGKKDFSLDLPYVQTKDDATSLMAWLTSKITKPRKSVGLEIFSTPILQLGDIVNIEYLEGDLDRLSSSDKRFVIYNISYSRDFSGPKMTVYLSEVL